MECRSEERHIAILATVGVFLLCFLIAFIVVLHFLNISREKAKHLGKLELQVIEEQLNSTFSQQTLFLKFFSTTVSRELEAKGVIEIDEFASYNDLLKETNGYFSEVVLRPKQELVGIIPAELIQRAISNEQKPLFFGPYQSSNNEYFVTAYHTIPFHEPDTKNETWGYILVTYDFKQIMEEAGINNLLENYTFSIRTNNSSGLDSHIFGDEALFENDFLHMTFSFSLLNWDIVLVPRSGWLIWSNITILLTCVSIVLTLLVTIVSYHLTKRLLWMRRQAYSDDMTGFLNKTEFMRLLRLEIDRCKKSDSRIALALLDIDNFKTINDRYGHAEGDRALLALVNTISQTVYRYDVLGRFGGDEFAILFRNMDTESAPYLAAKRVFRTIGKLEVEISSKQVEIQTSMGVAIFGIDGVEAQTLIKQADMALYTAKKNGKNMLAFS